MHMADALVSPAVGGTMWAVTAGTVAYCSAKVRAELDDRRVPLMGVLGAFLFAAQMINFTIPATGSSGHLGGGLLLAVLLGPHAALLTIASVLVVQALFFADGGLLALGCNIFNLGVFPAFVAYPLIYRRMAGAQPGRWRLNLAAVAAAVAGLQLGSLAVVLETVSSGISSLPFSTFVLLMQPIHLAIGIVEGVATAAVLSFVCAARPDIVRGAPDACPTGAHSFRTVAFGFLAAALLTGGGLSLYASNNPDGLEWSIARMTGNKGVKGPQRGVHGTLAALQERTALLPDYAFTKSSADNTKTSAARTRGDDGEALGTSLSGIIGGVITLGVAFLCGRALKRRACSA